MQEHQISKKSLFWRIKRKLKYIGSYFRLAQLFVVSLSREKEPLVIVTGSDSMYYLSLIQFAKSLYKHEPQIKLVMYDLGLTIKEKKELKEKYPLAEIKKFDFSKYPDYFNIKINAGEYAWKPVILADTMEEYKCNVCWMDSGNVITGQLFWIRVMLNTIGFYSPYSCEVISDWTHPSTIDFFSLPKEMLTKPNLAGGCVAVSYREKNARMAIRSWKKYALIKECIAPEGSHIENHRQDQSVLTIIAHQADLTKYMPVANYGFKFHARNAGGNP